jgi:hypothetical protein
MAPAYPDLNDSEQKLAKLVIAQALQAGKTLPSSAFFAQYRLSVILFQDAASGIKVSLM